MGDRCAKNSVIKRLGGVSVHKRKKGSVGEGTLVGDFEVSRYKNQLNTSLLSIF